MKKKKLKKLIGKMENFRQNYLSLQDYSGPEKLRVIDIAKEIVSLSEDEYNVAMEASKHDKGRPLANFDLSVRLFNAFRTFDLFYLNELKQWINENGIKVFRSIRGFGKLTEEELINFLNKEKIPFKL